MHGHFKKIIKMATSILMKDKKKQGQALVPQKQDHFHLLSQELDQIQQVSSHQNLLFSYEKQYTKK